MVRPNLISAGRLSTVTHLTATSLFGGWMMKSIMFSFFEKNMYEYLRLESADEC